MTRSHGSRRRQGSIGVCCFAACLASCAPSAPARDSSAGSTSTPAAEPAGTGSATPSPAPTAPPSLETAPGSAGQSTSNGAPSANASGEIELDTDDSLDADIAELSKATKTGPEKASDLSGRDIVYRVTPQGLVIEVDGMHLRPAAKAFRDATGNYGVQLTLTAESFDNRQYWLSKPADGPLALAGKIEAPAGKKERFSHQRRGESQEEVVRAGEPRTFKQHWPGKGQPKLRAGQTLTLEVGLWGMRAESERERPVKRLFELKLLAAHPPQAVISPPTLDWGN